MGEISKHDLFGRAIIDTVRQYNLQRNLEIGSWDGTGSTSCFIEGMKDLTSPELVCIEVQKPRYEELVKNTAAYPWVKCVNESTISHKSFIYKTFDEVWNSPYNHINCDRATVETWYNEDVQNIKHLESGYLEKDTSFYDGILIDGGEFFGYSEYQLIKDRCNVLFLDDYFKAFKTRQVAEELNASDDWEAIAGDKNTRQGFAIFKRRVFIQ
jgi:hypothetical protein